MNFLVFDSFRGPKNNILGTIMSRFSAEKFCLVIPKNFVGNPCVLSFRKFLVETKFIDK